MILEFHYPLDTQGGPCIWVKKAITKETGKYNLQQFKLNPTWSVRRTSAHLDTQQQQHVSPTSVHRILKENRTHFTVLKQRGRDPNTTDMIEYRKEVVRLTAAAQRKGLRVVFVDETTWTNTTPRKQGWVLIGGFGYCNDKNIPFDLSAITLIGSANGAEYAHMVDGTVQTDDFVKALNLFQCTLVDENVLFIMDNATVHDHERVGEAVIAFKNWVGYNSPYSPDINPIEQFFSIGKRRVAAGMYDCKKKEDDSDFVYR